MRYREIKKEGIEEWKIRTNLAVYVVCMLGSNKWNVFLIQRIPNGLADFPSIFITFLDKQNTYKF